MVETRILIKVELQNNHTIYKKKWFLTFIVVALFEI